MISKSRQLLFKILMLAWSQQGESCQPLHLTPLIDEGKISTALELSEVKDPQLIIPKSYAGFITTDRERGNHLFFWFFPSINDTEAPLLVWLNGGPTISSMYGLFFENGPIRIKTLENGNVIHEKRTKSWAEPFSMLYIDNPVGVGYSYSESNSYTTTQDGYSEELYVFIEQFYLMFPQYLHRELYIGGQSYAGKYVPAFAHKVHTMILANKSGIPLTGIYLGGPLFDPLTQLARYCDYYLIMGAVTYSQLVRYRQEIKELNDLVSSGGLDRLDFNEINNKVFPSFIPLNHSVDNYATGKEPDFGKLKKIMMACVMRTFLHVCDLKYEPYSSLLHGAFKMDFLVSTKSKLADLLNNYKVLLYTGDFDGIITSPMVEAALMTTPWSLQEQYNNSIRSIWAVGDRLKGFYTKTGQFCRVVVHGAGHQTPRDQPDSTLDMMTQFVQHGCILENAEK